MRKKAQYHKSIPGKPTPVQLSGLFLVSPNELLKVFGCSPSGLFGEMGDSTLAKVLNQINKGKCAQKPELLVSRALNLLNKSTIPSSISELFKAALDGDKPAQECISEWGTWEAFLRGVSNNDLSTLTPRSAHILAIEQACAEPFRLVNQGRLTEASQLLLADSLMQRFFWPEAIDIFNYHTEAQQLVPLQASISIEVLLSDLAACDAEYGPSLFETKESLMADILPTPERLDCNPTKLFFDWLKKQTGARSIDAMLNDKRFEGLEVDLVTLKRWSSGKHLPNPHLLQNLADAFFGKADQPAVWVRYWGAKYLNFIGYIAQECSQRAENLIATGIENSCRPWPNLPFGHTSFESWCHTRYLYWHEYHKAHINC